MKRWLAFATVVALAALPLAACAPTPANNTTPTNTTPSTPSTTTTGSATGTSTVGRQVYTAQIKPFNGSKVRGMAVITVNPDSTSGETSTTTGSAGTSETTGSTGATGSTTTSGTAGTVIRVVIVAVGLTPSQAHAMHIHGFTTGTPSAVPQGGTASDPTTESIAERAYGPVLMPLEPFPTASASGTVTFAKVLSAPADVLTPSLADKAIVIHGMDVNGTFDPAVPVGVGLLKLSRTDEGGSTGTSETSGTGIENGTGNGALDNGIQNGTGNGTEGTNQTNTSP